MQESQRVTRGEIGVRRELAKLGLKPDEIVEAIRSGESYRALCTPNDPRIFHGTTAWARTMRRLREVKIKQDWTPDEERNFPTIVSPNGRLAVNVTTGDKGTGVFIAGQSPKLKHPKGIMGETVVKRNRSGWLFTDMAADAKAKADKLKAIEKRVTWFLLIRLEGDVVFAELSLPWIFNESGQVDTWRRRIILDPIEIERSLAIDDREEVAEVIDIQVTKK